MVEIGCIFQVCRSAGAFFIIIIILLIEVAKQIAFIKIWEGLGMWCDIFFDEFWKRILHFEGFNTLLFFFYFFIFLFIYLFIYFKILQRILTLTNQADVYMIHPTSR